MNKILGIILGTVGVMTLSYPGTLSAQGVSTMLTLAPHCTATDETACTGFAVKNAESLTTGKLSAGDIVDIDIVLTTDTPGSVETVRSWLSYDSEILEARSIELTSAVQAPSPGEQNIDPIMRLIKVGGAVNGTLTKQRTVLARVTFRVKNSTKDTEISFHDFQIGGNGHTAVNGKPTGLRAKEKGLELPCIDKLIGCRGTTAALLLVKPSELSVVLAEPGTSLVGSVAQNTSGNTIDSMPEKKDEAEGTDAIEDALGMTIPKTMAQENSPAAEPKSTTETDSSRPGESSSFSLLQVQSVRVTSKERDIFLGWQALKSSALKGYNIYYGTVSGRYIQRKTVPGTTTSLVLRDLEPGTTYFLAIRALNDKDIESAFSQEVSVVVGNPDSSSAPLDTALSEEDEVDGNPLEKHDGTRIVGETGMSSTLILFLLISAVIGTGFAVNRQILLRHSTHG